MFDNFLSESNSGNHIYLEFNVQSFIKALSNSRTTRSVYTKLSRYRGTPGLVFDMEVFSLVGFPLDVGRDQHPPRHICESASSSGLQYL